MGSYHGPNILSNYILCLITRKGRFEGRFIVTYLILDQKIKPISSSVNQSQEIFDNVSCHIPTIDSFKGEHSKRQHLIPLVSLTILGVHICQILALTLQLKKEWNISGVWLFIDLGTTDYLSMI